MPGVDGSQPTPASNGQAPPADTNAVPELHVRIVEAEVKARDCQEFLCARRFPSCEHEALFEHDGELRLRLEPLARRPFPIRGGVVQDQI